MTRDDAEQPRQCIYCGEVKPADRFNREHVIPQGFGVFGTETPVIHCVCQACNQRFGETIDLELGRSSALGIFRYSLGICEVEDFKPPTRNARIKMTVDEPGPHYGAEVRFAVAPGGKWWEWPRPEIGFAETDDGPWTFRGLDDLPSGDEFNRRRWRRFTTRGEITHEQAAEVMRARGILSRVDSEAPAPTKAKLSSEFTFEQRRAIAKIGMNYLAYAAGPEVALRSEFDDIRAHIKGERDEGPFLLGAVYGLDPTGPDGRPRRGYYLTLQPMRDEIVSQVSIVTARYVVRLGRGPFLLRGGVRGHFLDLDLRTVEPMQVPDLRGTVRPPRPGETMHLTPWPKTEPPK